MTTDHIFETISEHWDRKSSSKISTCIFSTFLVFDSLDLLFFQPRLSDFLSSARFCLPTAYIFLHSLSLSIIRATVYHLTVMPHSLFSVFCARCQWGPSLFHAELPVGCSWPVLCIPYHTQSMSCCYIDILHLTSKICAGSFRYMKGCLWKD